MTRIVVGVDGSDGASQALVWALGEAKRQGATVHAVTAWAFPTLAAITPFPSPTLDEFRHMAETTLERALAAVAGDVPDGVDVTRRVVQGSPATVLAAEPASGDTLVVGRRGVGGFERLMLGSVSRSVLRRTHVPTVVVPATPGDGHGVIVGLDKLDDRVVVAAAIEEADRRMTGCTVIHAVESGFADATLVGGEATEALMDAAHGLVADALTTVNAGDVKVDGTAVLGPAGAVLVEAAKHAELLVLGRRSHGILGSVADTCAAHAACPGLVVPTA